MELKPGDIVAYKQDGKSSIEGVVVKHWKEPNPWRAGTIDNVDLFVTLDTSWPSKLHKIETFRNFSTQVWEVKSEV